MPDTVTEYDDLLVLDNRAIDEFLAMLDKAEADNTPTPNKEA